MRDGIQYTIQFGKKGYRGNIDTWIKRIVKSNLVTTTGVAMRAARQAWARTGMYV